MCVVEWELNRLQQFCELYTLQVQTEKRILPKHLHYNCSAYAFTWIRMLRAMKERQEN
jgi:hypothetical protein